VSLALSLRIAGIRLRAIADRPFDLEEGFSRFASGGAADLEVHVRAGGLPSGRGERPVWDSGRGWAVSRRGGDLVFRVDRAPNGHPPPIWLRLPRCGPAEAVIADDRPTFYNVLSVPLGPVLAIGALLERGGALLHGCGAVWDGRACAFPARSGGGKTTLAGNLCRIDGVRILSDDTLALLPSRRGWSLAGTPWSGHPEHATAEGAPLVGIGFLRKGRRHATRALSEGEATRRLLGRLFVAWWLPGGPQRALEAARAIAASADCRVATVTPTIGAGQFLVGSFASRESAAPAHFAR